MKSLEMNISQVPIEEYSAKKHATLLLAAYDELLQTPEGKKAIRSRFGFLIPRDKFEKYVLNPSLGYRAMIIGSDGIIQGWGEYYVDSQDWTCAELSRFIMPEHQVKGLGSKLLRHLIQTCRTRESGVKQIESLIDAENILAEKSLTKTLQEYCGTKVDLWNVGQKKFIFYLK